MKIELSKADLQKVQQAEHIDTLSLPELADLFRKEAGLSDFAPSGARSIDPRDGSVVVFSPKRAKRPHDNRQASPNTSTPNKPCPICSGNTTGVVDVAELSEGFTFINKNLFPCVYPFERDATDASQSQADAAGLHFLQWTSSLHDRDFHNMETDDLSIVLSRLGAVEKKLLEDPNDMMPETTKWHDGRAVRGFVSIIKNVGAPVGGSLSHGHQQLVYSNTMPTQTLNNWRFKERQGVLFSEYLQQTTPERLIIKDLGEAVVLVPSFMKRPYFAMLALKDTRKQYLYDLNESERQAVARGWSKMVWAYRRMLPRMGREIAYNVLVHTGPGAGLYIEFLPFTQETGGYEQLGLWVCQGEPESAAEILRDYFQDA